MSIDITIPLRTPTLNEWQRMHWGKRRRVGQAMAWALLAALGQDRPQHPLQRCSVHVERTSTREPDPDSLIAGLKPLLDALQPASKRHPYGIGLIVDDDARCITRLSALHVAGKTEQTRIVICEAV